jgi:hypothetical protein
MEERGAILLFPGHRKRLCFILCSLFNVYWVTDLALYDVTHATNISNSSRKLLLLCTHNKLSTPINQSCINMSIQLYLKSFQEELVRKKTKKIFGEKTLVKMSFCRLKKLL